MWLKHVNSDVWNLYAAFDSLLFCSGWMNIGLKAVKCSVLLHHNGCVAFAIMSLCVYLFFLFKQTLHLAPPSGGKKYVRLPQIQSFSIPSSVKSSSAQTEHLHSITWDWVMLLLGLCCDIWVALASTVYAAMHMESTCFLYLVRHLILEQPPWSE